MMKTIQHSLFLMLAIILMTIQPTHAAESVITRQNVSRLVQLGAIEDGSEFRALAMSPLEDTFLVATETELWQYALPDLTATRIMTFPPEIAPLSDMAYHPNGQIVSLLDGRGVLYDVQLSDGAILNINSDYEDNVEYIAYHPEQEIRVLVGDGDMIPILDEQNDRFFHFIVKSDVLGAVTFSPDGRWIAIGSADDLIVVYDTHSWERHYVFTRGARGPARDVTALTFSPDSRLIVSGGFQVLSVWDNITFQRLHRIDFSNWVTGIIFSHDGDMLIVADADGQLSFFDSTTYAEIAMFEAHNDWIFELVISPDGRYIVSMSYDDVIQVWGVSG